MNIKINHTQTPSNREFRDEDHVFSGVTLTISLQQKMIIFNVVENSRSEKINVVRMIRLIHPKVGTFQAKTIAEYWGF